MDDSVAAPTLHIQLLGGFRLAYGDEPVNEVDSPRLQSLLAYLLIHRDAPQSRHQLAFLFWPDSPEKQALANLRNLLYRLRHSLPASDRFLDVDRKTLQWRLDSPYDLDIARFEEALEQARETRGDRDATADRPLDTVVRALKEAIDLYRGDLLPSCYDDWIEAERERLRQGFEQGLAQLIQLLEDQREYRAAIRFAQRMIRHDSLNEVSYRRLIRLQALIGDRAGALVGMDVAGMGDAGTIHGLAELHQDRIGHGDAGRLVGSVAKEPEPESGEEK